MSKYNFQLPLPEIEKINNAVDTQQSEVTVTAFHYWYEKVIQAKVVVTFEASDIVDHIKVSLTINDNYVTDRDIHETILSEDTQWFIKTVLDCDLALIQGA